MSDGVKARALLEKLTADGAREALATIARAREEAERISQESARRLAAALTRAKSERLAQLAEGESAARMRATSEARRAGLDARRALVARVLTAAASRLGTAATTQWLAAEVERALAYLPDGAARVRCAPNDVRAVRRVVASRPDTTVVADDAVRAGVIAELADGSLVVDASAGSRLDRMRDALAIEIIAATERST